METDKSGGHEASTQQPPVVETAHDIGNTALTRHVDPEADMVWKGATAAIVKDGHM